MCNTVGGMTQPLPQIVTRGELLADGFTDTEMQRLRRHGDLRTVRRGRFLRGAAADGDIGDAVSAHRLQVMASTTTESVVISHISAAVMWDLPIYAAELSRVHLTRRCATGAKRRANQQLHSGALGPDEFQNLSGLFVTSIARTLADLCRTESTATAVVAVDAALNQGLVTADDLVNAVELSRGRHGAGAARRVLRLVDCRSESPGESRLRLTLRDVVPLDPQPVLRDDHDRFVARVDFGIKEALLLLEFDGREKYAKFLRPGESIQDAILREKRREDALRARGWILIRIIWSDLADPERLVRQVLSAYLLGLALVDRGSRAAGSYQSTPALIVAR